jgi:hypothetical protein
MNATTTRQRIRELGITYLDHGVTTHGTCRVPGCGQSFPCQTRRYCEDTLFPPLTRQQPRLRQWGR